MALNNSINNPHLDYRIIEFIYNLKHQCGSNKLHASLSSRLFEEFLKSRQNKEYSAKFNAVLCKYLLKELQADNFNCEKCAE
jgi:uncharacterized phage-associated protein